jgi:hypothetical protein
MSYLLIYARKSAIRTKPGTIVCTNSTNIFVTSVVNVCNCNQTNVTFKFVHNSLSDVHFDDNNKRTFVFRAFCIDSNSIGFLRSHFIMKCNIITNSMRHSTTDGAVLIAPATAPKSVLNTVHDAFSIPADFCSESSFTTEASIDSAFFPKIANGINYLQVVPSVTSK